MNVADANEYARFLYWLLLLDQFESGVWGHSIDNSDQLYGAKHDLGSISVSVNCTSALLVMTGGKRTEVIRRFREYLISRRSSNGAFGMMRSLGSSDYPSFEVLEHSRHTAGAVQYFYSQDGVSHPYVRGGIAYLLDKKNRTPNGLWVDFGERIDDRVDPITVSTIVGCLHQLDLKGSVSAPAESEFASRAEQAIEMGLKFLFEEAYRTQDGMWLYRFRNEEEKTRNKRNAYRYSMGIAAAIAPVCIHLDYKIGELLSLQSRLQSVFEQYCGFIPISEQHNEPSISTTQNWLKLSAALGKHPPETDSAYLGFKRVIFDPETLTVNAAPGWAAILWSLSHSHEVKFLDSHELEQIWNYADESRNEYKNAVEAGDLKGFILSSIGKFSDMNSIAKREKGTPLPPDLARKILILAANPTDTSPLDLEDELRSLEKEVEGSAHSALIEIRVGHAARPDDLVKLVRRESPAIVHFSGHANATGIALRDEVGNTKIVSSQNLARFLSERGVSLAVLNACYTDEQASDIIKSVPCVVGTTAAVDDGAAKQFSLAFYRSIGDGLTFGEAFRDACDSVSLSGFENVFRLLGDENLRMFERSIA